MTKRDVIIAALNGERVPYVPWSCGFTLEAWQKLVAHFGETEIGTQMPEHFADGGNACGFFEPVGNDCVRDHFGVVWDRSIDKDIGVVRGQVLPEPSLANYDFPDPLAPRVFEGMDRLVGDRERFRVFSIGFSLYERAWTLRGMAELMMDFIDHPAFVHVLLDTLADYNIAQVKQAVKWDIDAVYFGDDWGQQSSLQMGPATWRTFIEPRVRRMYAAVKDAGKYVMIHSCGDVDELFDDLIDAGLDCFNPFQPEVMDVDALLARYRGRLTFHGGLSTQRTLPYGSEADVRAATRHLLDQGREGNYIFAPAHAVEGDVPLENMLAFLDELKQQPGFQG